MLIQKRLLSDLLVEFELLNAQRLLGDMELMDGVLVSLFYSDILFIEVFLIFNDLIELLVDCCQLSLQIMFLLLSC